ncbi:hypothetical protein WP12_22130 [Sphingomonas sp. SRS2]|nr:hypothetical protein WP12_22130 [Sphingomonas sp. SRS2]
MTLLEKNIPYVEHVVSLAKGENLTPDYLAINPRGLVPSMTFDDRSLFDSATIMRFANNWFTGPELAPSDPVAVAAMNSWIDRSDDFPVRGFTYRSHLASGHPDYWRVAMHDNVVRARELYPEFSEVYDLKLRDWHDLADWLQSPRDSQEGEAIAEAMADDAEAALRANPFLVGDAISLADISVFILFIRLQCACDVTLWSTTMRPHLHRWAETIKTRPSYDGAVLEPYRSTGLVQMSGDCWQPGVRAA